MPFRPIDDIEPELMIGSVRAPMTTSHSREYRHGSSKERDTNAETRPMASLPATRMGHGVTGAIPTLPATSHDGCNGHSVEVCPLSIGPDSIWLL